MGSPTRPVPSPAAVPVCAVQLGARHEELQKLVRVLPEIKLKVRGARPSQRSTGMARSQGQEIGWVEGLAEGASEARPAAGTPGLIPACVQ